MVNSIILVFVGGAFGAMMREAMMLMVPNLADNFPLDILVANVAASFLLGLITGAHRSQVVSDDVNTMVATGIMGGMSTFSSFAYGSVVLISASVASAVVALVYVAVSLALGYFAVIVGMKLGAQARRQSDVTAGSAP